MAILWCVYGSSIQYIDLHNPYVHICLDICFNLEALRVEEGEVHNKSSVQIPIGLPAKVGTAAQWGALTLTAITMMIKIIPKTSPMMFSILAVLDASEALVESPMALAFCAF